MTLDRSIRFWSLLGFDVVERDDGYLVLQADGVELHFAHDQQTQDQPTHAQTSSPGRVFVHVRDATSLWKRLRDAETIDIGPITAQEHGLREFALTDPDGNHIRIGSPTDDR